MNKSLTIFYINLFKSVFLLFLLLLVSYILYIKKILEKRTKSIALHFDILIQKKNNNIISGMKNYTQIFIFSLYWNNKLCDISFFYPIFLSHFELFIKKKNNTLKLKYIFSKKKTQRTFFVKKKTYFPNAVWCLL